MPKNTRTDHGVKLVLRSWSQCWPLCRMWRRSWRCRSGWSRRWSCPWRCWRRISARSRTLWWSSGSSWKTYVPSTNSWATSHRWGCFSCSFSCEQDVSNCPVVLSQVYLSAFAKHIKCCCFFFKLGKKRCIMPQYAVTINSVVVSCMR